MLPSDIEWTAVEPFEGTMIGHWVWEWFTWWPGYRERLDNGDCEE